MKASFCKYDLVFKEPAVTSRSVMNTKETYFLKIWDEANPNIYGLGECAIFRGLSADDVPEYEEKLQELCDCISSNKQCDLSSFSSIKFGIETAILDFSSGGKRIYFDSPILRGNAPITINGLVWMGNKEEMLSRLDDKMAHGFKCIKLKIGGIDFNEELELIRHIREKYTSDMLQIRLDANGAFIPSEALDKLKELSKYDIHSIEQPIKAGNWSLMGLLCKLSPIPIALDEELIGITDLQEKEMMLRMVQPQYIILKPSLCGGFSGTSEWIRMARDMNIGWWATSALESNIGLNAIAQWTSGMQVTIPQGLGTGSLYTNNIESPLEQIDDYITYNPQKEWKYPELKWI